jgi:hypothetical protein
MAARHLQAEHGVVCSMPTEFLGYFGWPSVARLDDGTLVAVASGLRSEHVCPFGRTVLCTSADEGRTWTAPRVLNDGPLDDRDAGVVCLGDRRLLVTWFSSDTRRYYSSEWIQSIVRALPPEKQAWWAAGMARMTDDAKARFEGAWLRVSADGGDTWGPPVRAPLNSPHGPIRRRDGSLLYLGKECGTFEGLGGGRVVAMASNDSGSTWSALGAVPLVPGTDWNSYHEAHVAELPDGQLIGTIRLQNCAGPNGDVTKVGLIDFSVLQTESADGGRTWSVPHGLGFHGSPPHILWHSSGRLVLTYGYRLAPFGQRVALSADGGRTWQSDWLLRDDGPDGDLGYPATVELTGGELLSVYYQKPGAVADKCALLCSRWRLP